jgi:plastocyanin
LTIGAPWWKILPMGPRALGVVIAISSVLFPLVARGGDLVVRVRDRDGKPLERAVVWVPKTPAPPPEKDVVELDQRGLEFDPPLLVARVGQTLVVHNSDDALHSVHGQSECCRVNVALSKGTEHRVKLRDAGVSTILCDFHAHMRAVLVVVDSAFAWTDARGEARIPGLPAGTHAVHAIAFTHQRARADVTVGESGESEVAFALEPIAQASVVVTAETLAWPDLAKRIRGQLDIARSAALKGDVPSVRAALADAKERYFAGSGLRAELRSQLGRARTLDHEERLAKVSAALIEAAGKSDATERSKLVDATNDEASKLAKELDEDVAKLPARATPAPGNR